MTTCIVTITDGPEGTLNMEGRIDGLRIGGRIAAEQFSHAASHPLDRAAIGGQPQLWEGHVREKRPGIRVEAPFAE